jgi:hypothetical protein
MNGQDQMFGSLTGDGSITAGGATLAIGSDNSTSTFTGVITEGGSLVNRASK